MEFVINVQIDGQRLKLKDYCSLHISIREFYDKIVIKPFFSSEWDGLIKQIVFSTDCFDYQYVTIMEQEEIQIPEYFKDKEKIAIHFVGYDTQIGETKYRLPTNFLKIPTG